MNNTLTNRDAVIALIRTERNTWMWEFAHPTHMIARAVLGGLVTAEAVERFTGNPENPAGWVTAEWIAYAAGVKTRPDTIAEACEILRAIVAGDVGDDLKPATWTFTEDLMEEHPGVTFDDVRAVFAECKTIADAARLIIEADTNAPGY